MGCFKQTSEALLACAILHPANLDLDCAMETAALGVSGCPTFSGERDLLGGFLGMLRLVLSDFCTVVSHRPGRFPNFSARGHAA